MLNFTPNQWAIIALVLVLGWLLGLMSRSGGKRWKRELAEERAAHATLRREHDALRTGQDSRVAASNARIAELERDRPATGLAGGGIAAAARGQSDDLTRITGIDRNEELRLNEAGIHSYRDVEKMSADDEVRLEGRLGYEPNRITREDWRGQAAGMRKR